MSFFRKAGSVLLGMALLVVIFLAKNGDVHSLLRDLGLSHLVDGKVAIDPARADQAKYDTQADAMASKLEPFITCLNRVDTAMRSNYSAYSRTFPAALNGGAIYHRSFKIVPYEVNNQFSKECADGLLNVGNIPPTDVALDDVARQYAVTLTDLVPLMNAVDDYLGQENYRDDGWSKMRDLHPKLAGLFEKFLTISDRMRGAVETANFQLAEERLVEAEKENGRDYRWHQMNLVHQARLALNEIDRLVVTQTTGADVFLDVENGFENALNGARAYIAKNPQAKTPLGNRPVLFYIESRAGDVLTAIKTLRRNISGVKSTAIDEDYRRITNAFNSLIDDYNMRTQNGQ